MSLSTGEIVALFTDATGQREKLTAVKYDDGAGTNYVGWTSNPDTDTSKAEWNIVREVITGADFDYEFPKGADGKVLAGQQHVWDDRATLTY